MRPIRSALAASVAALLIAGLVPGSALAAPPTVEVVADGLLNPRGVEVGSDGTVYVAESGAGGTTLVQALVEGEPGWACFGDSGGITIVSRNGEVSRIGGFPSIAGAGGTPTSPTYAGAGFAAAGPADVAAFGRGTLAVTIGLGGSLATREAYPGALGARLGTIERVPAGGKARRLADLVAYEEAENPDGEVPDSNPYGLALLADGSRLATDAGGNDLLRVWPDGGIETVAAFGRNPATTVPALSCPGFPVPPGTPIPAQAVPTTVAVHDGHAYVGFLGGFPFTPGMTRIVSVDLATGAVTTVADGLTAIVGLAVAPDGTIYAVEMAAAGLLEGEVCGNLAGRLVRIDGSDVEPVDLPVPLIAPGGVAVGRDGTVYVTNGSIFPGGGELLAIRGL